MRAGLIVAMSLLAACAGPPVVVQQYAEVVLSCELHAIDDAEVPGKRATDALSWRELRAEFGGAVATLPGDYATLSVEHVVAVSLPPGVRVTRIDVIEEEDVDVITLSAQGGTPATPHACLLRLAARSLPVTVVLRNTAAGTERMLAAFPAP